MKITKRQLKQLIKEELSTVLQEEGLVDDFLRGTEHVAKTVPLGVKGLSGAVRAGLSGAIEDVFSGEWQRGAYDEWLASGGTGKEGEVVPFEDYLAHKQAMAEPFVGPLTTDQEHAEKIKDLRRD